MKKIIYLDRKNVKGEVTVYEPTDYLSVYSGIGSRPVLTNADGYIDQSLIRPGSATLLKLNRIANETIEIGDCVYSVSDTRVALATAHQNRNKSLVLGVAVTRADADDMVSVVVLGIVASDLFSVFDLNSPLYLDQAGGITDERPAAGYLVAIGKALGNSQIMVQVGYPTVIGG